MDWSTACVDWEKRIVEGRSMVPPPLFPDVAEQAMRVFDKLRIVDVAGSPEAGEITRDWLRDFVMCVFGAYDEETGVRHITEFFMLISKKNTKSTIAALVMLTLLIINWRRDAELLIIAPTKEVANNCFDPAASAVNIDDELREMLHVQPHIRTITHLGTNAKLKVVAADSNTVSGTKASIVLVEELWLFGKQANAENMLREATGGLVSREEGAIIYLTTQSDEPPTGVFKQKLDYARDVRDGIIEDRQFLPLIYEFPPDMIEQEAYLLPENFHITNPNLGASVSKSYLERELEKAQRTDKSSLIGFLAKHLNVEIGLNLRSDRWPGADYWEKASLGVPLSLQDVLDRSSVVTVGIDGGGLDDLLGLAVVGRDKHTRQWLLWCYAWAHPSVLTRRKDIASKLEELAKAGDMTLVDFVGQDTDEMETMLRTVVDSGLLHQVGLDPNAVGGVLDALLQAGVEEDKILNVTQGYKLAGPIKTMERKLATGTIKHGISLLMNWCVGNAKVKVVGNAIVVTKAVSGTAKIDPLMAAFNAVALMMLEPPDMNPDYDFTQMIIGG